MGDISGLRFTRGDGYSDEHISFSTDLVHLNLAFRAVTYTPRAHQSGHDKITVMVNDTAITDGKNVTGPAHMVTADIPVRIAPAASS